MQPDLRILLPAGSDHGRGLITKEVADGFFQQIGTQFRGEPVRPFITLFGGEPLIDTPTQKEIIRYIVAKAAGLDYEIAVVTNGYELSSYLPILTEAAVKEIQVTVDGPAVVHDARRPAKGGGKTFAAIMEGVENALCRGFPINFRVVVDRENISHLVPLAEDIESRGWLSIANNRFKTQIGRNYELFGKAKCHENLLSKTQLWTEFSRLAHANPVLHKFHQPEFYSVRHLILTGSLPVPLFDACPAGKKEWVYDLHGDIYGCTASCGRKKFKLGTYFPKTEFDHSTLSPWQNRNVMTIPNCQDCPVSLVCGGGCGAAAFEENGAVSSPNCRPVHELLKLGLDYYRHHIFDLAEGTSGLCTKI